MATPPTSVDNAPAVPISTDPETTFDAMFEAFHTWLSLTFLPWIRLIASGVYNNAVEASVAATTATAQAQASVAAVNVTKWVAGSYGEGVCAWSPTNGRTYRAKSAFTSATDPVLDPTHWWDIASFSQRSIAKLTTASTLSKGVHSMLATDGLAYPLPTSPTVGDWVGYRNTSGGTTLSLDPGAEKVEGASGVFTLDNPLAMGVLAYSGSTDGWVHVPA